MKDSLSIFSNSGELNIQSGRIQSLNFTQKQSLYCFLVAALSTAEV